MIENKLIFEFKNDDEFVAELSDCGLFNKLEDKRQNNFCFLHLTIQDFLAALHVVGDMNNVESFFSEHIDDPQWYLVMQFVSGLVGDKMRELERERNELKRLTEIQNAEKRQEELCKNEGITKSFCKRFPDWMPKTDTIENENDLLVINVYTRCK